MWWNFVARDHDEIARGPAGLGGRPRLRARRSPGRATGSARAADDAAQGAREPAPLADCPA